MLQAALQKLATACSSDISIAESPKRAWEIVNQRPPNIAIIHGVNDEIVPVAMGKELSCVYNTALRTNKSQRETLVRPAQCFFTAVPNSRHNDIFEKAEHVIYQSMEF